MNQHLTDFFGSSGFQDYVNDFKWPQNRNLALVAKDICYIRPDFLDDIFNILEKICVEEYSFMAPEVKLPIFWKKVQDYLNKHAIEKTDENLEIKRIFNNEK